jgi:Zn-dependent M28 family amino/carboxypeptidase
MIKNIIYTVSLGIAFSACQAQPQPNIKLNVKDVEAHIKTLSADDMRGRNALVKEDIAKAANYIAYQFEQAGLQPFNGLNYYFQNFKYQKLDLYNVVGVLPGKSLKDEYVIFSAHYDHIGLIKPTGTDSIANGADDDASGVAAVLELAKYYAQKKDNERTLIFVAFTAEEIGGYGSQFFSRQLNPDKVKAMFNIEMIGKESKFGKKNAFITGFNYSDFGKILQKNLKGSEFTFHPDPYPEQNLFYRSDNATLARLGVPAHTISTVQIDKDTYYHTVDDEIATLDAENVTETIKGIIISATSIIKGDDTPSRVSLKR